MIFLCSFEWFGGVIDWFEELNMIFDSSCVVLCFKRNVLKWCCHCLLSSRHLSDLKV